MKLLPPLTRTQLDVAQCSCGEPNPKTGHAEHDLHLHGRCHMDAPVKAVYNRKTGILTLECAVCLRRVAQIFVAKDLIQ